jgi:predicted membrane protein
MATAHAAVADPAAWPVLAFRADSANGASSYPSPGAASPWVDLRGAHSGALSSFDLSQASGWTGNGTPESPRRLEYSGIGERVTVPGGSIPELQTADPVTAAMWFRTSFDAPSAKIRYLLEWLDTGDHGMSIAVENGHLRVYLHPWVDVAALAPDTWYHVAVAKTADSIRVYVNGAQVYAAAGSYLGVQTTPLAVGCSVYRMNEGDGTFDDFWNGSIAQVEVWRGALSYGDVAARYQADRALYPLTPPLPTPARVVELRGDRANGAGPYPTPGSGSPFVDLTAPSANAALLQFDGTSASGWQGNGTIGDAHRLRFDGANDVLRIAPAGVAELQNAHAQSAELWMRTGADVTTEQYWMEWLTAFGRPWGLSLGTANGQLRVYDGAPDWAAIAPVMPNTWYHVVITKEPGAMRAYVNGTRALTDTHPDFGAPVSEIALGASIYRGPGQYGERFSGELGQASLWQGALDDAGAQAAYQTDRALYENYTLTAQAAWDGDIVPSGPVLVPQHGSQSFTFVPLAGFHVASVSVDGVAMGAAPGWTFSDVSANHVLNVTFAPDTPIFYTVTATAGAHGAVSPAGDVSVAHRGTQTFAFLPDTGWHVAAVNVDGAPVAVGSSYTFTNVTASHTLDASFAIDVDTVLATAGAHGAIAPAGAVPVVFGTDQAFTITPDAGWRIHDLRIDGISHGPLAAWTFTAVAGPHTIAASFTPVPMPLVTLRADSASGTGPAPTPGGASPWHDLRGGHDATLANFIGTRASGWNGDGTLASPWRLEYTGQEERAVIPPASVPELMTPDPVSAAVWVQTSGDGDGDPTRRYLLEWIEPSERGMAISIHQGHLGVFLNGQDWVDVATLAPGRWYHVAAVKETDEVRMYVNGVRVFTAPGNFLGTQVTPIGIGCSTYRAADGTPFPYWYGDYFVGAIGAVEIWRGALLDGEVHARFLADSSEYLPNPALPVPSRLMDLRADRADGDHPPALPGAQGPWVDLTGAAHNATLHNFDGVTSGWNGAGTALDPFRLHFDGVDDAVTLPAATFPQLLPPVACSAELWVRTPSDVARQGVLLEWLESFARTTGMSVDIADSTLRVYLDHPGWAACAPVAPNTWYHIVVTKQPGEVRAYLNGTRVFTANTPHLGDQSTELTIGASTWRGPGQYGDFFAGDMGEVAVWNGALDDSGAAQAYRDGRERFVTWPLAASTSGAQGSIAPAGTVTVPHGGSQDFAIAPSAGYELADVLVDGASVGKMTHYAFTNVTCGHAIYARFRAIDTVAPKVTIRDPNGGDIYGSGQRHLIFWRIIDSGGVRDLDVLYSLDNGLTWLPVATAIPDSGMCNWQVPNVTTTTARVKVVARDSTGNVGSDVNDAPFAIQPPVLAVPDGDWRLALAGFTRNPVTTDLRVAFTLPDAAPARLELVDLTGRRLRSMEVGVLGAGPHLVDLGREGAPPAGVYFLRLTHPAGTLTRKAVVMR